MLTVKPFGKVVICAGTTGYNLDFDVRYLWMRQKEIIGSHFANAYECTEGQRADRAEQDPARPVADDGLRGGPRGPPADAATTSISGKIAILVGAAEAGQGKTEEGPGAIHAEVGA